MVRSTALLLASVALAVLLASGVALVAASPPATVASAQTNQKPNLLVVTIDDADLETYNDAGAPQGDDHGPGRLLRGLLRLQPSVLPEPCDIPERPVLSQHGRHDQHPALRRLREV